MDAKKLGIAAAAAVTLGAGVVGGAAIAAASSGGSGQSPYGGPPGYGRGGELRGAPHQHTQVTGDERSKVEAAVKKKDSTITVSQVLQDPDGSYDVFGTKSGQPVMLQVSKDLTTVTERTHGRDGPGRGFGGPGGPGGPGGASTDKTVTGSELAKVKAAVKAKDADVTVLAVREDPDGSYDVFGKSGDRPVMLEVSKDLTTITERTGGPHGDKGAPPAPPSA